MVCGDEHRKGHSPRFMSQLCPLICGTFYLSGPLFPDLESGVLSHSELLNTNRGKPVGAVKPRASGQHLKEEQEEGRGRGRTLR